MPKTIDQPTAVSSAVERDRLITLAEVMNVVGVRRTTIYQMIKERTFPQPVKPRPRASRWVEREVLGWLEEQVKSRNTLGRG